MSSNMNNEEVYTVFEMTLRRYQLKINKRKTKPNKESLQSSLRYILGLSQIFGLLPCRGILGCDSSRLKFGVFSLRVLWAGVVLCVHLFMCSMALRDMLNTGLLLRTCNVLMIYMTGLVIHLLYFHLGINWPKFMKQWTKLEGLMSDHGYPKNLSRKIRIFIGCALLFVLFEYTLSIWHAIHNLYMIKDRNADVLQEMYELQFSFINQYMEYSMVLAVFALVCNFICMFVWNINDLLIIVVSIALSARFKQIKHRIIRTRKHCVNFEKTWQILREDYNHVMKLFQSIESAMSYTVLVSFVTNLYFILVQLFQILHEKHSEVGNIYFSSSFGMLVLRTFTVSLFAAQINDNSKELLFQLTQVPSEIYTQEIEWLMMQIVNEPIALTGCKLFKITRGLVFRIASTIVTYELFLFQFDMSLHNENRTDEPLNKSAMKYYTM